MQAIFDKRNKALKLLVCEEEDTTSISFRDTFTDNTLSLRVNVHAIHRTGPWPRLMPTCQLSRRPTSLIVRVHCSRHLFRQPTVSRARCFFPDDIVHCPCPYVSTLLHVINAVVRATSAPPESPETSERKRSAF